MWQMQKLTSYFTSKDCLSVYMYYYILYDISAPVDRCLILLVLEFEFLMHGSTQFLFLHSCIFQDYLQIRENQRNFQWCIVLFQSNDFPQTYAHIKLSVTIAK